MFFKCLGEGSTEYSLQVGRARACFRDSGGLRDNLTMLSILTVFFKIDLKKISSKSGGVETNMESSARRRVQGFAMLTLFGGRVGEWVLDSKGKNAN